MQYCAVYINQGLNAHREAFSPAIIIEELLLQRFLHTLENRKIPLFLAAFLCQDLILPVLLL